MNSSPFNILVVEDDELKAKSISDALSDKFHDAVKLTRARSVNGAILALSESEFDLTIIDLFLPQEDEGDPDMAGGIKLYRTATTSNRVNTSTSFVGLTAYESLQYLASEVGSKTPWHVIGYDAGNSVWKEQLSAKIQFLMSSSEDSDDSDTQEVFDLAIVTALHSPELRALLSNGWKWSNLIVSGDAVEYFSTQVESCGHNIRIVAASTSQMGMVAATTLASSMINHFSPSWICALGIAAGMPDETNYGDILIAEQSWDYNAGKLASDEDDVAYLQPDPKVIELNSDLRNIFASLARNRSYLDSIQSEWTSTSPPSRLELRLGPVASGAAVIARGEFCEELKTHQRKIVGLEMETYGIFYAARNCPNPKPIPFSVKSVCDFANEEKSDDFQPYAAYTSSMFLTKFVENDFGRLV